MPKIVREYIPIGEDWRIAQTGDHEVTDYRRRMRERKKDSKSGKKGEVYEEWVECYHSTLLSSLNCIIQRDALAATSVKGMISRLNTIHSHIKIMLEQTHG